VSGFLFRPLFRKRMRILLFDFSRLEAFRADFYSFVSAVNEGFYRLDIRHETAESPSGYSLADAALAFCHTSAAYIPAACRFFAADRTFPCHM
jgi:hypothetical protein